MARKKVKKTTSKPLYVEVSSIGTAGSPATFPSGTPGKLYGLKSKAGGAAGKSKAAYGLNEPSSWQLHDGGLGVELAAPPTRLETRPQEQETELADRLVAAVADNGPDVRELCGTYGLKREELGRLTGFSLRALAEWAGGRLPSQPAKRRLQEVRRLLDALAEIVKRESIPKWLHQPNPAFDRLTPLQVIELGEIDRLWAMVHDLGAGQPS